MDDDGVDHRVSDARREDAWAVATLVGAGTLAAILAAVVNCELPVVQSLSWEQVLVRSLGDLLVTVAAGFAGVWLAWAVLLTKPRFGVNDLAWRATLGWVFLPGMALLFHEGSLWTLLLAGIGGALVAWAIRGFLPTNHPLQPAPAGGFQALYGLPPLGPGPGRAFVVAVCAQAALGLGLAGHLLAAAPLAAVATFVLGTMRGEPRPAMRQRSSSVVWVAALLVTLAAFVPWVRTTRHGGTAADLLAKARATRAAGTPSRRDYLSLILWAPPKPKNEILPPVPRKASRARGGLAREVVIPFDGAYWYFESPFSEPGPLAHVAHGLPTDKLVNVRSTNGVPLLMEAHQKLGKPIDVSGCGAIEISVVNADARAGQISLGAALIDSSGPGRPMQWLGVKPLRRDGTQETLRFPVAAPLKIRRFDEIKVFFLPGAVHPERGAKVAIEGFTLVPAG